MPLFHAIFEQPRAGRRAGEAAQGAGLPEPAARAAERDDIAAARAALHGAGGDDEDRQPDPGAAGAAGAEEDDEPAAGEPDQRGDHREAGTAEGDPAGHVRQEQEQAGLHRGAVSAAAEPPQRRRAQRDQQKQRRPSGGRRGRSGVQVPDTAVRDQVPRGGWGDWGGGDDQEPKDRAAQAGEGEQQRAVRLGPAAPAADDAWRPRGGSPGQFQQWQRGPDQAHGQRGASFQSGAAAGAADRAVPAAAELFHASTAGRASVDQAEAGASTQASGRPQPTASAVHSTAGQQQKVR